MEKCIYGGEGVIRAISSISINVGGGGGNISISSMISEGKWKIQSYPW